MSGASACVCVCVYIEKSCLFEHGVCADVKKPFYIVLVK